jgi:hypothetical protein
VVVTVTISVVVADADADAMFTRTDTHLSVGWRNRADRCRSKGKRRRCERNVQHLHGFLRPFVQIQCASAKSVPKKVLEPISYQRVTGAFVVPRRESVRRADFFAIGAVTRCRRWSTANYLRGYGWREGEANHQVLRPLE